MSFCLTDAELRLAGANDSVLWRLRPCTLTCRAGPHLACRRTAAWSLSSDGSWRMMIAAAHLLRLPGPQRHHASGGRAAPVNRRAARRHGGISPLHQARSGQQPSPAVRAGRGPLEDERSVAAAPGQFEGNVAPVGAQRAASLLTRVVNPHRPSPSCRHGGPATGPAPPAPLPGLPQNHGGDPGARGLGPAGPVCARLYGRLLVL